MSVLENAPAPAEEPRRGMNLAQVARNMASLVASDVVNRITSFVIYLLVGRYLGAQAFGQMSLALSLFYTFQVFAIAGFKTLVTREVAKDKSRTEAYFVNSSIIVVFSTLISMVLLYLFVQVMGYAEPAALIQLVPLDPSRWVHMQAVQVNTAEVILLIGLGLMPFALTAVTEAVFQAWERMTFIAYVNAPANLLRIALIFILTTGGSGLRDIALVLLGSYVVVLLVEWSLLVWKIIRPRIRFDPPIARKLLRESVTFLGIDAVIAVSTSLLMVLLSRLIGEGAVGLYSAAVQLIGPLIILYQAVVLSVFPIMCNRFDPSDNRDMKRISNNLLEMLLLVAIPMSTGLFILADWGLQFIYGDPEFVEATTALRVMTVVVLGNAVTAVFGRVLVASMRERTTLRITVINMFVMAFAGYFFILEFGLIGAIFAVAISNFIDVAQHYVPVSRMLGGVPVLGLLWKPVTASAAMAAVLLLAANMGVPPLLQIPIGMVVYFATLGAMLYLTIGGPKKVKARYLGAETA